MGFVSDLTAANANGLKDGAILGVYVGSLVTALSFVLTIFSVASGDCNTPNDVDDAPPNDAEDALPEDEPEEVVRPMRPRPMINFMKMQVAPEQEERGTQTHVNPQDDFEFNVW